MGLEEEGPERDRCTDRQLSMPWRERVRLGFLAVPRSKGVPDLGKALDRS